MDTESLFGLGIITRHSTLYIGLGIMAVGAFIMIITPYIEEHIIEEGSNLTSTSKYTWIGMWVIFAGLFILMWAPQST